MATEKVLNTVIQLRNGTAAEWASSTLILRQAEIGIENDTGLFKIGNGKDLFKDLEYANDIKGQISKSEHRYLDVEKAEGDTDQQAIDKAIAAYTNFGDARNGDVCIVRKVIGEGHWEYTAYAYSNDVGGWIAMDGNYSADNVYFSEDLVYTADIGVLKVPASGSGIIAAKNKNLTSIVKSTIAQAKDPSVSNPAAHVTLNQAGSKEAGTKLVPSYTASLTAGSYTYGPATGIVAETYSVTDGVEGHEAQTTATGSFPEIQVTDGMNYKLSVSITHNAGSIPKNNVGTEVPAKQIAAGTKTATSSSITSYRNSFYGSVTDKTAALDSAAIRALSGKSGKTNAAGNTFNASESVGAMRVIIAVPAPRICTSIKDVNGLNAEALSAFTKTTVNVEGANGYEAKAYNVYYKDNAAACDKANNWAVTLG